VKVALAVLLCCAPLAADLAQVRAEPNLEKRSHAALDLAEKSLRASRQAYADGDMQRSAALLEEMTQAVDLAETSLHGTGKDPIKSPKHFKYAEIKTVDLLRRIEAFSQGMSVLDRPMLDQARVKVQEAHDRLLHSIMTGKKK
jgi:hypothetical protein